MTHFMGNYEKLQRELDSRSVEIEALKQSLLKRESNPAGFNDLMSQKSNDRVQQGFDDLPSVVDVNVGGKIFTTFKSTLCKSPTSMLAAMFSGRFDLAKDPKGRIFIDRNPRCFEFLLNYLRTDNLRFPDPYLSPDSYELYLDLIKEFNYFQIPYNTFSESDKSRLIEISHDRTVAEVKQRKPFVTPFEELNLKSFFFISSDHWIVDKGVTSCKIYIDNIGCGVAVGLVTDAVDISSSDNDTNWITFSSNGMFDVFGEYKSKDERVGFDTGDCVGIEVSVKERIVKFQVNNGNCIEINYAKNKRFHGKLKVAFKMSYYAKITLF